MNTLANVPGPSYWTPSRIVGSIMCGTGLLFLLGAAVRWTSPESRALRTLRQLGAKDWFGVSLRDDTLIALLLIGVALLLVGSLIFFRILTAKADRRYARPMLIIPLVLFAAFVAYRFLFG